MITPSDTIVINKPERIGHTTRSPSSRPKKNVRLILVLREDMRCTPRKSAA
jgi:hypothetical protein